MQLNTPQMPQLKAICSSAVINVLGREIGTQTFARLYQESETPILVTDKIAITVPVGFRVKGTKWSAYQTILPGRFFYDLIRNTASTFLVPNIRDYLGSRASDLNINYGIKQTAEEEPDNFWGVQQRNNSAGQWAASQAA